MKPRPEGQSEGLAPPPDEGGEARFDPYRFQTMEVSPDLRVELARAKLPRLEAKYFDDTSPEERAVDSARRPRVHPGKSVLAVAVLVALVAAVALAFLLALSRHA